EGRLTAARKQFDILVKRWPESPQTADALQALGAIYFKQGENEKAFETYEKLIKSYYTGLTDYDQVLENQYAIAKREMNRKRMKLLFGGYSAPERAIPYLKSIIKNAPQWKRAPEIQFEIGEAYRANKQYTEAIAAYSTLEYRYPDSSFAEKAAFAKIQSLQVLVEKTPYSVDLREDAQLAVEIFSAGYPESAYRDEVARFKSDLAERAAKNDFETARFYERVPDPVKKEAALVYYKKVVDEHPDTDYAARAKVRLKVLQPQERPSEPEMHEVEKENAQVDRGPLPDRMVEDEEAIEVTADRLEVEGDLLVGEGNVAVQQKGASLQADHVSVNPETGDVTAMGNIVMLYDGSRWEGEELIYNFKTKEGNFSASDLYFDPVYITAEQTERVSSNEYRMVNARLTTCSGDEPLIYAKAREVTLLDDDTPGGPFIKAKDVTFYVGKVPVFYTPYWHRHLGYRVFTFSVGYGGRLGAFIMGRAELHPTDWLTSNTYLDLYSKRGVGFGQDFNWTTPNGAGSLTTYAISDGDPYEEDDTAAERALIDSQRYRIGLDHREQFDE
ncbi:MAG TPA: tetratricopeptide repeat protein, partial [Tichowtungia sp.]|nr:tetratricopeptide repeat protein [Tichowtungia sp.]